MSPHDGSSDDTNLLDQNNKVSCHYTETPSTLITVCEERLHFLSSLGISSPLEENPSKTINTPNDGRVYYFNVCLKYKRMIFSVSLRLNLHINFLKKIVKIQNLPPKTIVI